MVVKHGGDVVGYELEYGCPPLDFSASLNPLGMPKGVLRAARAALDEAEAYPDPYCRRLRTALGQKLGLAPERLFIGNGAADVIDRLALAAAPGRALLTAPTFGEYGRALQTAGHPIEHYALKSEDGFALGEGFTEAITKGTALVFIGQPGNPTGQPVAPALLAAVLHRCERVGALLVLDECFVPFMENAANYSLLGRLGESQNLCILGSFTKLYAMAGLRLGFAACGSAALPGQLAAAGQPWAVSTVAQAAGLAALAEDAYVNESVQLVHRERRRMLTALPATGCKIIGAGANYIFFHAPAPALARRLAAAGILIRDCAGFTGLGPGYYRVAVRLPAENDRLLLALQAQLDSIEKEGTPHDQAR